MSAFLLFYEWSRERAMLKVFGLVRAPARPVQEYVLDSGPDVLVWSGAGFALVLGALLAVNVADEVAITFSRRRWARRGLVLGGLAVAVLMTVAVLDDAPASVLFAALLVLWVGWLVYRRVRASEKLFRSEPLRLRMYAIDAGLAMMLLAVVAAGAFGAAVDAGVSDASQVSRVGPWVTVYSTVPLGLDKSVHGTFCERDMGGSGFRYRYEGFRQVWVNGNRHHLLSVAGGAIGRTVIPLDDGGSIRLESRDGRLPAAGCVGA